MKYLSLFICLLFTASCSDPVTSSAPDNTVSLTFIAATESDIELNLVNATHEPIFYLGYSKSSPLKRVEILSDTGWTTVAWDWCATGANRQEVKPNETAVVYAPLMRKNVTTRVRFGYQAGQENEYIDLISDEFFVP